MVHRGSLHTIGINSDCDSACNMHMTAALHGVELCLVESFTACSSVQQPILMMLPDDISSALGLQMVAFACSLLIVNIKHTLSSLTAVWACAQYCKVLQQKAAMGSKAKGNKGLTAKGNKGQQWAALSSMGSKGQRRAHSQGQQRASTSAARSAVQEAYIA